jgi:hypothetical protein
MRKENQRAGATREGAEINIFDCGKPLVRNLKTAGTLVCMLFRRVGKCV